MMQKHTPGNSTLLRQAVAAAGVAALTATLGWAVWTLPSFSDQLRNQVMTNLSVSGVENPVTAVLLNFRAYDTLLEIAVLLAAVVGVFSLNLTPIRPAVPPPGRMQLLLLRLLPLIIIFGAYVLWIGKYAPGGTFQAGALLAAGGVPMVSSAVRASQPVLKLIPLALSMGLLIFIGVATATMIPGASFLQYPVSWAGTLILVIEAAATVSITVTLTLLYVGGTPESKPPPVK